MKKLLFLSALLIFSNGNSQTIQRLDKIYKSYSILNEDFLKPLLLEHKEKYKKDQLVVNDSLKRVALERALNDCEECFIHNPYYANSQKANAKNNPFKINFLDFISHNNFYLESNQMFTSLVNGNVINFKEFRKLYKDNLKSKGIKKKSNQMIVYNKLLEKISNLSLELLKFYHNYDYQMIFWTNWNKQYPDLLLYHKQTKSTDSHKKLIRDKISPNFNPIDAVLVNPDLISSTKNFNSRKKAMELFKKRRWVIMKDKDSFKYPSIIYDSLSKRSKQLAKYFNYTAPSFTEIKTKIIKLWYDDFNSKFSLQCLLDYEPDIISKEDFLFTKNSSLENTVGGLRSKLIHIYGTNYIKLFPYKNIMQNVIYNYYGITNEDISEARSAEALRIEAELNLKGGMLRDKSFYKITPKGELYYLVFYGGFGFEFDRFRSSGYSRKTSSRYYSFPESIEYNGNYIKTSNNVYTLSNIYNTHQETYNPENIKVKLSSDGKKLYYGNEKAPYISFEDLQFEIPTPIPEVLKNKAKTGSMDYDFSNLIEGAWWSLDGKESFCNDCEFNYSGNAKWRSVDFWTGGGDLLTEVDILKIDKNNFIFYRRFEDYDFANTSDIKLHKKWTTNHMEVIKIRLSDDYKTIYFSYKDGRKKKMLFIAE